MSISCKLFFRGGHHWHKMYAYAIRPIMLFDPRLCYFNHSEISSAAFTGLGDLGRGWDRDWGYLYKKFIEVLCSIFFSDLDDDVTSLSQFSTELIVEAAARCVKVMRPSLELTYKLPPSMAARFRVGTCLAQAVAVSNNSSLIQSWIPLTR